jgi:hypothetical protein
MKKLFGLMLLWLSAAAPCLAQGAMTSFTVTDPISSSPQLFHLNPEQYNHHFEYPLPNDGKLQVDFLRLSDWEGKGPLKAITEAAANQVNMLKDSFNSNYSTKLLEMNIPIDGKVIALNYLEEEKGKRQLAYKEGTYYQLKTGFDTVRVIKNVGIRTKPLTDSGLVQVQYTFILKDINDLVTLANDPETINKIGDLTDEAVNKYRNQWNNQDARTHQLSLEYDPAKEKVVRASSNNNSGLFKYFDVYMGIGAMVYTNNSVSPYFEESIAYLIPSRSKMQPFVGFNLSGFGFFNTNGSKGNASYLSYNFEYGICKRGFAFMQQKTSIMLGVMRVQNPDQTKNHLFHMGFTFGFNSFFSAGFNAATDFKKNSDKSILGVHFKFNL